MEIQRHHKDALSVLPNGMLNILFFSLLIFFLLCFILHWFKVTQLLASLSMNTHSPFSPWLIRSGGKAFPVRRGFRELGVLGQLFASIQFTELLQEDQFAWGRGKKPNKGEKQVTASPEAVLEELREG